MGAVLESEASSAEPVVAAPVLSAVVAEFDSPQSVTAAARAVRAAGYTKMDAHTPFPFHELDEAVGIGRTRLPWITLCAAATGGSLALLMQWWMNAVDYPLVISGKPVFSIPSDMPVIFECCVLFAAISTLIGMLLLNGLPKLSNPLFKSERFRRATNDRFFISIDANDPKFDRDAALNLLNANGALGVDECYTDPQELRIPGYVWQIALVLISLLCIPPTIIARMRYTDSPLPRFHVMQDMDFQPKFKAQAANALFADDRAMRPQIAGTVARGDLESNDAFYRGLQDGEAPVQAALTAFQAPADGNATPPADATQPSGDAPAAGQQGDGAPASGAPADGAPQDPLDQMPWVTEFPIEVTEAAMRRGQERFNIYCSTCHGLGGDGDGLITQRALQLEQGTWVRPVSFHSDAVRNQPVGRLFNTITHGVRKMPPMGDVVPPQDRWAILLYVRALQRSRNATIEDVPPELVPQLEGR